MPSKKSNRLKNLKSSIYKIYGIFDFQQKQLIFVDLDLEAVELEFDFENRDDKRFAIVEFDVALF